MENNLLKYSGRSYSQSDEDLKINGVDDKLKKIKDKLNIDTMSDENASNISDEDKIKPVTKNMLYTRSSSSEKEDNKENTTKLKNKVTIGVTNINSNKVNVAGKIIQQNQKSNVISHNKHHTAYTYSTIVKIKKEEKQVKKSVFNEKILGKKYNGQSDRVALYQYLKKEWNKTPILKKKKEKIQLATKKLLNQIII